MATDPDAAGDAERRWLAAYDARHALYERHFGPLPANVHRLRNLMMVWPGGCLVEGDGGPAGGRVTISHGLTNADLPADPMLVGATIAGELLDAGLLTEDEADGIQTPEARQVRQGLAGYGYELLVHTRHEARWPLMFLNWAVPHEILHGLDLLNRVEEFGAVTVEDVGLGHGRGADFLIAPAAAPLPTGLELPNGTARLLVATAITRPELVFALEHDGPSLLRLLTEHGHGQTSDLERPSVV
jgi:hypothetical protein